MEFPGIQRQLNDEGFEAYAGQSVFCEGNVVGSVVGMNVTTMSRKCGRAQQSQNSQILEDVLIIKRSF